MRHSWSIAAASLVGTCALINCVGDDPAPVGPTGAADAASDGPVVGVDGATDGAGPDDAASDTSTADAALPPLTTVPSVVIGYGFSCALRSTGRVYCWGSNN